jgi:hypothetical protein
LRKVLSELFKDVPNVITRIIKERQRENKHRQQPEDLLTDRRGTGSVGHRPESCAQGMEHQGQLDSTCEKEEAKSTFFSTTCKGIHPANLVWISAFKHSRKINLYFFKPLDMMKFVKP